MVSWGALPPHSLSSAPLLVRRSPGPLVVALAACVFAARAGEFGASALSRGLGLTFGDGVAWAAGEETVRGDPRNQEDASAPVWPLEGCKGLECVERYVALPDASFAWHDTGVRIAGVDEATGVHWEGHVLNVTSQRWRSEEEVSNPLWWHTVVVVVPDVVEFPDFVAVNLAFGWFTNDTTKLHNFRQHMPKDPIMNPNGLDVGLDQVTLADNLSNLRVAAAGAAHVAVRSRSLGACVVGLLHERQVFANDPKKFDRVGDFIKAFTYLDFLNNPSRPELISELPVAKAAVRSLDVIEAFTEGRASRFGVFAYSKFGITTYILGAIDDRVHVIAPGAQPLALMDEVEMSGEELAVFEEAMFQPPRSVGTPKPNTPLEREQAIAMQLSYAVIFGKAATPAYDRLASIIDPARWVERLALPKLLLMATNDEVLGSSALPNLLESLHTLPGPSTLIQLPACEHDHTVERGLPYIAAFFRGHLLGLAAPRVAWELPQEPLGGVLRATTLGPSPPPLLRVQRWHGPVSPFDFTKNTPWKVEGALRNGTWATDETPITESGPQFAVDASFLSFEFAWPEPDFVFAVSTPMRWTRQRR